MPESAAGWELAEHTADVGVRGWAPDLPRLFAVMASGLFAVIADPATVRDRGARTVRVVGDSPEDLLHEWLEALNTLHQVRGELYSRFSVTVLGDRVEGAAHGEALNPARHRLRTEVKAVTWHDLRVEEGPEGFRAYVLLDI